MYHDNGYSYSDIITPLNLECGYMIILLITYYCHFRVLEMKDFIYVLPIYML